MEQEHYLFGRSLSTSGPLSPELLEDVTREARQAAPRLGDIPVMDLVEVLARCGRLWASPRYEGRRLALEHLPEVVGTSREMVEQGLEVLVELLSRNNLLAKLRYELGMPETLDHWIWRGGYQGYLRAVPLGVVAHVSPGNVFLGAADSLVHGLLSKNANILKASSQDPLFPLLFAASLRRADRRKLLAGSFAVVSFPGSSPAHQRALKQGVDGLVVWGGEQAVEAWAADLPVGVKFVRYGPRLSLALVTLAYLQRHGVREVAASVARDVVMWEQRACGSPQALFVQMPEPGGQEELIQELLEALTGELEALSGVFPPPELSLDEQIEILRERELARFGELTGDSQLRTPPRSLRWSLIWRNRADRLGSPLNRCLVVHPFSSFPEVAEALEGTRRTLQTLGVGALGGELRQLSELLAPLGVTRFTRPGHMHHGKMGSPHDGTFQLAQLLRWTCIESVEERFDVGKRLDPAAHARPGEEERFDKSARLMDLLDFVRENSPFYHERMRDLALDGPQDLAKVPLLDPDDIRAHTPPVGQGLLTGTFEGAYVFASGGSTGAPKFTLYSYEEWDEVTSLLSSIYEVAGITPGDTVGNLFMAGNLWTSFLAASQALEKLGGVTLPIAGNAEIDQIMRYLEMFRPTALLGLPSVLIQIAEQAERQRLSLEIPKILYGGEHLYREARDYLERVLGSKIVLSAGYASVDAGPIGYQCPHHRGGVHHLLYHYQYLELLHPETHQTVEPGQVGEVVITCLNRRLMPLIRYRTGDLARMVESDCPCGRRTPLFELKGRANDVLRVGTVSLYPDDVAAALDQVQGLSHLFQIVAAREGARDCLRILAETLDSPDGTLADQARTVILARSQELDEALREGWLGSLTVELLPPGGLPRIPRTGKIRRVVDRRS